MRVLNFSLFYLLINACITSASSFWSPYKIKNKVLTRLDKHPVKNFNDIDCDITWDDGEVAWENMQEYQETNQSYVVIKRPVQKSLQNNFHLYQTTPLYETIEIDQTKIASITALVRTSYREAFNIDTLISELHGKLTSHYSNIPAEFVIISMLTGLAIVYNKTNETEKERLEKLYVLTKPEDYHKKYKMMKRFSMMAFIVLSCLTTRNVQPVE
jgi:hypothetical protein